MNYYRGCFFNHINGLLIRFFYVIYQTIRNWVWQAGSFYKRKGIIRIKCNNLHGKKVENKKSHL